MAHTHTHHRSHIDQDRPLPDGAKVLAGGILVLPLVIWLIPVVAGV